MARDAFTGGVDPGGLFTKNDIRILICYVLSSVNAPLSAEDISQVLQGRALANYFETAEALEALCSLGHIFEDGEGYSISPTGREIANDLDTELPLAVRDKALEAALKLLSMARSRRENQVSITLSGEGCRVSCRVSGGAGVELMDLSLYVPDMAQAKLVEEGFYRDPESLYRLVLSHLTGDKEYVKDIVQHVQQQPDTKTNNRSST